MSSNPDFKRRATDKTGQNDQSATPRERRKRQRRKPSEFNDEIEAMLAHVEPEVRQEIRLLIGKGKQVEARKTLIDYAVKSDRADLIQGIVQKKTKPVEEVLSWRVWLVTILIVLVLLYCIGCLLTRGRVELP
jgi:hypothetical protein